MSTNCTTASLDCPTQEPAPLPVAPCRYRTTTTAGIRNLVTRKRRPERSADLTEWLTVGGKIWIQEEFVLLLKMTLRTQFISYTECQMKEYPLRPCLMKRKWSGIESVKCNNGLKAWRDFLNGSLWDFSAKDTGFRVYGHLLFLTESQCLLEQAACGLASAGDHMTKSHNGACTAMETSHECPTKCDTTVDPVCSNANVTYSLCPLQSMQSSIKRNIL